MLRTTLILVFVLFCSISYGATYQEIRDKDNILIGYKVSNTSFGLHDSREYRRFLRWQSAGGVADLDTGVLTKIREAKIEEYKVEGLRRIQAQVPEWDTYKRVAFIASAWNMLGVPNAAQTSAKDIYIYVKHVAIPAIKLLNIIEEIQAYPGTPASPIGVINDPNWP